MEMKISSRRPGRSTADCSSDPEQKEISEGEDEDDDRNHKHRRREAGSQFLEGDSLDQGLTKPYRKRNRPPENGYSYREGNPQSGETWKSYNTASGRDFPTRFEKRYSNQASFSRAQLYLNQRIRGGQMLSGEDVPVRGMGMEPISWPLHDSRLGLVDVASQIIQPGPFPSGLFAGRGLPDVSSSQGTSWNAFGMVPRVPNGGLGALHPLGLRGAMRPGISPTMNIGIPPQRCRDFEERGFCLRGDMCPMEHGVNRIVIEDVQSLSQFNLPVSFPGSQLLGTSSGVGASPLLNNASGSLTSSEAFHAKSSKPGMTKDCLGGLSGGGVGGGSLVGASDVYDPDQPLWTNDNLETSAALQAFGQSKVDDKGSFLDMKTSDRQNIESYEGFDDERQVRNVASVGSDNPSVWRRIGSPKCRLGFKEKIESVGTSSACLELDANIEEALNVDPPDVPAHRGKWMNVDRDGVLVKGSSRKQHIDSVQNTQKLPPKAVRTVFVYGIPPKDKKKEALLSHFQKFGDVVDIYTPMHNDRAFVQFSKREEAEAALMAPDAVMGNRFIKLRWANRDNIPDERRSGTNGGLVTCGGMTLKSAPRPFLLDKGKENPHPAGGKEHSFVAQVLGHGQLKPIITNSSQASPMQPKNMASIERLKEELRKKQEILDQKRIEFQRQLNKLEKQAVGSKDVTVLGLTSKKLKDETPPEHANAETPPELAKAEMPPACAKVETPPACAKAETPPAHAKAEMPSEHAKAETPSEHAKAETPSEHAKAETPSEHAKAEISKSSKVDDVATKSITTAEPAMLRKSTSSTDLALHECLKPLIQPPAPVWIPSIPNRFKLDNRPRAFTIASPLPAGLANVAVLEEHFSIYGDLSSVELEESKLQDSNCDPSVPACVSARVSFTTRHSAEKAFLRGKCWQGHKLQFMWLTSVSSGNEGGGISGNLSVSSNMAVKGLEANVQPVVNASCTHSQEADALESVKPGSVTRESDADSVEMGKDSESTLTSFSSEKQLS